MMQFNYFAPTKVFFGSECIRKNAGELTRWGKKALLVTGRNSARVSGALADVTAVLEAGGVAWEVYDKVEENPTIAGVEAGGAVARAFGPAVIIAIGGGSPLDAAKAIAVLAVNDIAGSQLFAGGFAAAPLPIVAVPLTAGTGSEITPYSILIDHERRTKRSFADPTIFPRVAFLDARYTQTQSQSLTVNAAADALSHSLEGYLSNRATPLSDCLALDGMRAFGAASAALASGSLGLAEREQLLYASLLGGIVISHTGTTSVHALGYSLTYFRGVAHGRANGLLLAEFLRQHETIAPARAAAILEALGVGTVDEFKGLMGRLLAAEKPYSGAELAEFAGIASQAANLNNNIRRPTVAELEGLLRASLPVA
jgi:alcohol dehydrogenase class IV